MSEHQLHMGWQSWAAEHEPKHLEPARPDDQQCPQTGWLADLRNLISSAEDKEFKKKKANLKKNTQINGPFYSVYLSLPIQVTAFTKQRKNEYSGHFLHSHARTLKIHMPFLLLWGICTASQLFIC